MKKILSLTACSALVLGFAATASAVHIEAPAETSSVVAKGGLITIDGSIRSRGLAETNQMMTNKDHTKNGYDTRARLGITAKTSDAISGRLLLETWNGSGASSDGYGWGDSGGGLHNGGETRGSLQVLEAWANYMPSNWGVKVGHMPLALGNKLFFDHTGSGDDAIVGYMNLGEATHLAALTIKVAEGSSSASSDDADAYVALATHKVSDALQLGINYTNIHVGEATADALGGTTAADSANLSNLGLTIDGKVGGISYGLDGEFQFGDMVTSMGTGTGRDDLGGMAFQATAGMELGAVKVGALFGWGSGDDKADGDYDAFVNFLTDTRYQSTIVGYRKATPTLGAGAGGVNTTKNTGLANLTIFQLNAATSTKCPLTGKDLALKVRANYLQLNETVAAAADDSLGIELEGFATWKLGNGLVYGIEAAYLFADDGWDTTAPYNGSQVEDAFFLRHRLELKF